MHDSPWGGSEELWSRTATLLAEQGHDVFASVAQRPRQSDRLAVLAQHGVRIETHSSPQVHPARRIWNRLSASNARAYERLKRNRPDLVVISQGYNSGGFAWARVCAEAKIPYVIIVHCNSELWWFPDEVNASAVASYTGARKVFCVSRSNLDLLRLQVGEPLPNAEVIWNPCNVSSQSAPPWPEDLSGWRIACVARLDAVAKGQDLLLRTMALKEWQNRPIQLNLFGTGPHERGLRRMAGMLHLSNVTFHGYVTDVRSIWAQNHLLVLPSRYEGLPLSLVEAMWCGRPAVVTDVGGSAELCVDGDVGFVAPAATVASLSDALERAWNRRSEWPKMGNTARARVESLLPHDPVSLFAEQLKACFVDKSMEGVDAPAKLVGK